MFQSFYTGLSGMLSFSRSLDTVSNNIANMNTPGFRGADSFYQSLSQGGGEQSGAGVQISGLGFRFSNGEIRQTGNNTDLAVNGAGFFTLLKGNQTFFSRAGQFTFDDKGILIERSSGAAVAVLNAGGQPGVLDLSGLRNVSSTPTSKISFNGNLAKSATTAHEIKGLVVYNKIGEEVKVDVKIEKDGVVPDAWKVTLLNEAGATLHQGEVRFGPDGTPLAAFNTINFNLTDSYGGKTAIALNFGNPGDFSKSTSLSTGTAHSMKAKVEDGAAAGTLSDVTFDETGTVKLKYSNSVNKDGPSLALMDIANKEALQHVEGSIFSLANKSDAVLGKAGEKGLGKISAKSLELSNVDLSKEFADMIVIQRGYQASSKIMNVANQMLDQLFENTRGR